MAKKFDLAELMAQGKVPELDTAKHREQIEYIDIDLIDDDPNNFYELSAIDELAENIELLGLQQPLRVRSGKGGRVVIVSGHRRRAAIRKLVDDGREDLREIPCIRERAEGSEAMRELRLIYANSDTRRMTSADISKQAERVEALLYQLKEEGYEFPGRMRDHVAEACKVSKSKLARLKVIRENLAAVWRPYWESGGIGESTAYELAQAPKSHQTAIFEGRAKANKNIKFLYQGSVVVAKAAIEAVTKLKCPKDGFPCENFDAKLLHAGAAQQYEHCPCGSCCANCRNLATCKDACHKLADQVKDMKAAQAAGRKEAKKAQEERDAPDIAKRTQLWERFGRARSAADKTMKELYTACGYSYCVVDEDDAMKLETLERKCTTNTRLPYGSVLLSDVDTLVSVADQLSVSLDYLLCRTDEPQGFAAARAEKPDNRLAAEPQPLQWHDSKERKRIGQRAVGVFAGALTHGKPIERIAEWNGEDWCFEFGEKIEAECLRWFPLPDEEDEHDD